MYQRTGFLKSTNVLFNYVYLQSDYLSGKPGNVMDFAKSQGSVREKIMSGKVAKNCL